MDVLVLFYFGVILFFFILLIIYIYFKYQYRYWKRRGIPSIQCTFPFGCVNGLMKTVHIYEFVQNVYNEMKGKTPLCGAIFIIRPAAIILDVQLIKKILIKDFNCFENRGLFYNEKDDPLSAHLFSVDGKMWRILRSKLSPTFTSGKMKFMYPTIIQVAENLKNTLNDIVGDTDHQLEIKDILARFTTDVIGTCAFGIECNSLTDPHAKFLKMGRKTFAEPRNNPTVGFAMHTFSSFSKLFKLKVISDDVTEFFINIVKQTIRYREENDVRRNDFMDILIKLKNRVPIEGDENSGPLTVNEIAAQAFIFFLAGFETSSTIMSFSLYELAINQTIQNRARNEIKAVLKKHNGRFTYESMNDMAYIQQILSETLRKYTPNSVLFRQSSKEYYIPELKYVMPKGTPIWIPIHAIHHDPEYYPNPEVFDPDHFTAEKVTNRNPMTYLPFGDGPRSCIGLRFGMMQAKIGLVTMLLNFQFTVGSKTTIPIKIAKKEFILSPEGGLWLNMTKCS